MTHRKRHHHSVGLGHSFLTRARIVFVFSFLSVSILLGLAIFNSNKTGEIQKNLITPIKRAALSFIENMNNEPKTPIPTPFLDNNNVTNTVIIKSETRIITPTPTQTNSYYESSYDTYYQSSYTPTKSFEDIVAENNKWFEEKKAENEKWFQEQSARNGEEYRSRYDAAVQEMNAEYEANLQKAREEQEAWKKEHGF